MKRMTWLVAALICLAGCKSCGDEPTENNENNANANNTNNASNNNNGTNNNNNGTNNTNTGTNNPLTNNAPEECTPAYQYEDWQVVTDRRLIKACSPYIVGSQSVEVTEGAELHMDPGVEIQLSAGEWIRVRAGKIVANGTAEEPIVFTSSEGTPGAGSWLGLQLEGDIEAGNEISHAIFEYGGDDQFSTRGCLTVTNQVSANRITLTDTTFRSCAQSGLAAEAPAFLELTRLTFEDMPDLGMALSAETVGQVAETFTYTNVNANAITTAPVTQSATWVSQGIPYRVQESLEVNGTADPVLTLEAGVHLQFNNQEWMRVGNADGGGLVVNGTEAEPVVFESAAGTKAAGDWLGIRVEGNILGGSALNFLEVRHAGQDAFGQLGCLHVQSDAAGRVSVQNSVFEQCALSGVAAPRVGFEFSAFEGNTFRDSMVGVHLSPTAISSIGTQTYENVTMNRIEGGQMPASGTWVSQSVPWRVSQSIDVNGENNPVLTIEGPNTFQFSGGEWLRVGNVGGGGLVISGTAADPVVFQSASGTTAAGDWLGLRFEGNVLSGTVIDGAVIEHAGEDGFGQRGSVTIIGATSGRISILNSTFADCAQACIANNVDDFFFGAVTNNTFRTSPYGFRLKPSAIGGITDGQTYDQVPANQLEGGVLRQSATWVTQSVPWDVVASIDVNGTSAPVLTIESGNAFRFDGDWIRVGNVEPGSIVVNGTAAAPVRFSSRAGSPAAGDWLGIRFNGETSSGTLLNFVNVQHAGLNQFGQNGAVHLLDTGTAVTITNSTFSNNAQTDIWVDVDSMPTLSGNTGTVTNE